MAYLRQEIKPDTEEMEYTVEIITNQPVIMLPNQWQKTQRSRERLGRTQRDAFIVTLGSLLCIHLANNFMEYQNNSTRFFIFVLLLHTVAPPTLKSHWFRILLHTNNCKVQQSGSRCTKIH